MKTFNESHLIALPIARLVRLDSLCNNGGRLVMKSDYEKYIGVKFGRLTVVRLAGYYKNGRAKRVMVYCECECGGNRTSILKDIKNGKTRSCGCMVKEGHSSTHRMTKTSEYSSYSNMLSRCTNPKTRNYKDYGARGITVRQRWLESFENFIGDMGMKPTREHSIDRIDNDGNYEPNNCRWATRKQQSENKRPMKTLRLISHNGETMNMKEWSRKIGINYATLVDRMSIQKMSFEQAIAKPFKSNNT